MDTLVEPRQITVTGEAEIKVKPNRAQIVLGATSLDENLTKAKSDNDEIIAKIPRIAGQHNVKPEAIQYDYMRIQPQFDRNDDGVKPAKFLIIRTVQITLDDLGQLESLISDLVISGVNLVTDIDFENSDLEKYKEDARTKAITAAQNRAKAISEQLNQKIGKPLVISDERAMWRMPRRLRTIRAGGFLQKEAGLRGITAGGAMMDDGISPAEITVKAEISITFELESS